MSKAPYAERGDLEKVAANWKKTLGLFARREYSVSIVRAAVTAELTMNYAIRQELHVQRSLPLAFVDGLLRWANGLDGKVTRLLVPILAATPHADAIIPITRQFQRLNSERNAIAHQGEFRNEEPAQAWITIAEEHVNRLVSLYQPQFKLAPFDPHVTQVRSVMIPGGPMVQMPMHPESDRD